MTDERQEPIILVGAPSAAGKSHLGRAIAARQLAPLLDLVQSDLEFSQRDLKSLPQRLQDDRIHIIEIATQRMERYEHAGFWRNLHTNIEKRPFIIHVTLDVEKPRILKNYFFRIFTEKKKRSSIFRMLDLSSYVRQHLRLLRYIVTDEIGDAKRQWEIFGRSLRSRNASQRIVFVRAVPSGSSYSITIQPE